MFKTKLRSWVRKIISSGDKKKIISMKQNIMLIGLKTIIDKIKEGYYFGYI